MTAKAADFPTKMGITETRTMRLQTLQIALPYEVEVLAVVPTTDPVLERRLHRQFED